MRIGDAAVFALIEACRSTCRNSRRGAVVFDAAEDILGILGSGHNHLPDGTGLCCARDCADTSCGRRAVHAEAAAICDALDIDG